MTLVNSMIWDIISLAAPASSQDDDMHFARAVSAFDQLLGNIGCFAWPGYNRGVAGLGKCRIALRLLGLLPAFQIGQNLLRLQQGDMKIGQERCRPITSSAAFQN